MDELDELEDEEDEEFLNQYRFATMPPSGWRSDLTKISCSQKRLEELATVSKKSMYGQVFHLQKPDYTRDVTEASQTSLVLVHLASSLSNNVESRLLTELWRELARTFADVKFCEIQADMCIEGYPEANCPTILAYRGGEIVKQLLTLRELNGQQTRQDGPCDVVDAFLA